MQPLVVGGVEVELSGEVVEHLEAGVEPGLDGPLAQEPGGERVDRLDVRAVQAGERGVDALALVVVRRRGERLLELLADARGELGGGRLREGDDGDLVHGRVAGAEDLDDPRRRARSSCPCRRPPPRTGSLSRSVRMRSRTRLVDRDEGRSRDLPHLGEALDPRVVALALADPRAADVAQVAGSRSSGRSRPTARDGSRPSAIPSRMRAEHLLDLVATRLESSPLKGICLSPPRRETTW